MLIINAVVYLGRYGLKPFKSGTLSLGIDDIGNDVAAALVGAKVDQNGVLISSGDDVSNYVAIGFRAKKANGKYKYYWFLRSHRYFNTHCFTSVGSYDVYISKANVSSGFIPFFTRKKIKK